MPSGHRIPPCPLLPQQPAYAPYADLVLLGKLPAGSTGFEGRDDRLYLSIVQTVSKPSCRKPGVMVLTLRAAGSLTTVKGLVELPREFIQVMQEVATVQVGVEEADSLKCQILTLGQRSERQPEVIGALNETWQWLFSHCRVAGDSTESSADAIRVARRGRELLAGGFPLLRAVERLEVDLVPSWNARHSRDSAEHSPGTCSAETPC